MTTGQRERFSMDLATAGLAAVLSKSAAAPLEKVKLLLQNQEGELIKRGRLRRPYTGIGDCFRRVLREDGFLFFWRGNQANVIRYFPTQKTLAADDIAGLCCGFSTSIMGITLYRGMYFGIYDMMKPVVLVGPPEGNFFASFFLGWSITTVSGVFTYPFDTLRRRMMLTSGQLAKYWSSLHAFQEIFRHEGFGALYRGVTLNMLLGMAGAGVLAGYHQLQRIVYRHGYSPEPRRSIMK